MSDAADMTRVETDSLGPVDVQSDRLWGAQTQRSLENFEIGRDRYVWGRTVIESLGAVKKVAAMANHECGVLDEDRALRIAAAAGEVIAGEHDIDFPLVVFQTGSGTHTNMNANEVIANRANQLHPERAPVHPNNHVNASQSSNDVFPTVMHLSLVLELRRRLYPAVDAIVATLTDLAATHADLVKVGRTHLQDATPITLGQEIESWAAQIRAAGAAIRRLEPDLRELALGGTATGTGLNAPRDFGRIAIERLADEFHVPFIQTGNHLAATAAHDAVLNLSALLRTLAGALMKMGNDIRWLASGPAAGLGELRIPANEPGSSIMPGKVNPSQIEALTMVAAQVIGNDATVAFAATQGSFQLNAYKPVMLHNTLDSIQLLADTAVSFHKHCLVGIEPDRERIAEHLASNPMIATALTPYLGYDAAAQIVKTAWREGRTIRDVALSATQLDPDVYDRLVDPLALARPHPEA
jgi:fumarate hydratase class II